MACPSCGTRSDRRSRDSQRRCLDRLRRPRARAHPRYAHQKKELRNALRNVRDIARASLAAMRGDPPSVTGKHAASKKRPRDEPESPSDESDEMAIEKIDLEELLDSLLE